MTQEERKLFLNDLCERLMYGIWFQSYHSEENIEGKGTFNFYIDIESENSAGKLLALSKTDNNKPYLRRMNSITDKEIKEIQKINSQFTFYSRVNIMGCFAADDGGCTVNEMEQILDFLNRRHIDYRGLIDKGLALEAPADMYN